jgi:hemerythrin-like metal-binding protein
MELIKWNSTYEGGVPEIDLQHQKLVEIINKLHDAMMLGQGMQVINEILDSLIEYTIFHFETEEKWMTGNQYLNVSQHQELHLKLTDQVQNFKEELETKGMSNTVRTNSFLKTWLTDHILGEDIKVMSILKK